MTPLMSMKDVSEYLQKPVPTLRAWRHREIGPRSFRVGCNVRYKREDVESWVEDQRAAAAP
jgi:predicted DNA-binding transcriptional regulator AlpA